MADVTIRHCYESMYQRAGDLFPEDFELDMSRLPQPRPHQ
jgi:hypothetical protein